MAIYNYLNPTIIRRPPVLNFRVVEGLQSVNVSPLLREARRDVEEQREVINTVYKKSRQEFEDWAAIKPRTQKQKYIAAFGIEYPRLQEGMLDEWEQYFLHLDMALSGAQEEQYLIGGDITTLLVEKAKNYPMEKIYPGELYDMGGGHLRGLCPYHDEKTPSFYIYPADSTHNYPHFYCFARQTEVLTRLGDRTIGEILGQPASILNGQGEWETVEFASYGCQHIWELVVKRGDRQQTIRTTADHIWHLNASKTAVKTKDLHQFDLLASNVEKGQKNQNGDWEVVNVRPTPDWEEVYCCETSTQSFTLAGNIWTHNCFGCHKFGSAIGLYMKIKHVSYEQAVQYLGRAS